MPISDRLNPAFGSSGRSKPDPLQLARERLIVALDVPDVSAAFHLVSKLENTCHWFKVGLELFRRGRSRRCGTDRCPRPLSLS